MIEEYDRDKYKIAFNEESSRDIPYVKTEPLKKEEKEEIRLHQEKPIKSKIFFTQLTLTSLLLWSVVFIEQSRCNINLSTYINKYLFYQTQNVQFNRFLLEIEEIIKQMIR